MRDRYEFSMVCALFVKSEMQDAIIVKATVYVFAGEKADCSGAPPLGDEIVGAVLRLKIVWNVIFGSFSANAP